MLPIGLQPFRKSKLGAQLPQGQVKPVRAVLNREKVSSVNQPVRNNLSLNNKKGIH
jgi:hypothetical protein